MSLIAMAVYSTEENKKDDQLRKTLQSLWDTVDFRKHRLILSVNGKTPETMNILFDYNDCIHQTIFNEENIGTAKAINKVWRMRETEEHCVKIDDDVVIHSQNWLEEMEEAIRRDPAIGIIGLKRKDLIECTTHPSQDFRSLLVQLPHQPGERWMVIERVKGVMGTCKMINYRLLNKIGYLNQPSVYGFDDSIYSTRSRLAGFINCFLPHIEIDHIDPGGTDYTTWKQQHAGQIMAEVQRMVNEYEIGSRPLYEA